MLQFTAHVTPVYEVFDRPNGKPVDRQRFERRSTSSPSPLDLFRPTVPNNGIRTPHLAEMVDDDGSQFNKNNDHDRWHDEAQIPIAPLRAERHGRDDQHREQGHHRMAEQTLQYSVRPSL